MKIGIVGLGFVGLSFASVLGSKGYSIIGIDSDKTKVAKIKTGRSPFYEPKLDELLKSALKKSLTISTDVRLAVNQCDIIFVTVGTPLSEKGQIDLTILKSAIEEIGNILATENKKPILVIKSTVVPGTTNDFVMPIIKNKIGKKISKIRILTNPEFLREGKSIDDTLKPHIVVIGGNNDESVKLKKFYQHLYGVKIPIILTNHQTAELIKYANNSFLATKISFVNQIANICQSIPGTNIEDVAKAIGLDPRIGSLFLKAGPGYGGSCLPKDLQALIAFSSKTGVEPILLKAVQETNNSQVKKILDLIERSIGNINGKQITILGLSFKEDSDDIRESVSIKLINLLLKKNVKIIAHDPKAIENTRSVFGNKIRFFDSVKKALRDSQCVVIMTPWKQYSGIKNADFQKMRRKFVIDTRRILNHKNLDIEYHALGLGE
ncbi:UDP-glucose dehydrogenase family protein [Candidatus Nitrosotalea okcheonensis]|uniref:UDP-glucose 6-dehydrogenase n=1 Tax=Candidatus Nitrosotalea okcheonensis TaxID=1903276 RepID=A0A2H1FHS6_9ARCH|nr:UDP-glucose/GDP-mannose dehydrogenase family protein [Candidatus Nitrosotalea okcheonensis]SMH72321.1 UDP-glucose 6-dehydrogenase [Candidatus Nitrosotalea okcheonensis]